MPFWGRIFRGGSDADGPQDPRWDFKFALGISRSIPVDLRPLGRLVEAGFATGLGLEQRGVVRAPRRRGPLGDLLAVVPLGLL